MQHKFPFQTLFIPIGIALLLAGLFFDMGTVVAQTPVMPTPDRLAQPTLPVNPSQADKGAQVYWLSCLPCHGARPYENGFTLPKAIPAVIGTGTLHKFPNALVLRSYVFAAMPYWRPASLTDEASWQVTAFLLRENNLLKAEEDLTESNAALIPVAFQTIVPTPLPSRSIGVAWKTFVFLLFVAGSIILIFLLIFRKPKS